MKGKTLEGLKTVRMRPTKTTYFMLCVGNKHAMAYLAPAVGAGHKTLLRPLMGKDTGLKYHRGQCIFEAGYYVFVGPTVQPGMRKKLEEGLVSLTGHRWRTKVRRGDIVAARQNSSAELPV